MKKLYFTLALFLLVGCKTPTKLILETDMGNDIEDAIAQQMSMRYIDTEKAELLAICVNKEGTAPVQFVDIMSTWYGHPEVPIGKITDGAFCKPDADFADEAVGLKDANGEPRYKGSISDYGTLPEATNLYRKLLSSQPDHSVTIASIGFSTNLLRLIGSEPDEYSKLTGEELVKKKVKKLAIMAGDFEDYTHVEYNVWRDVAAAKFIFEQWPTPVDVIPFKIGMQVHFPVSSIDNDFGWDPENPLVDAFNVYRKFRNEDSPMWDTPTVVLAVEGTEWFTMTPYGRVEVDNEGHTAFVPDEKGTRRLATLTDEQAKALQEYIIKEVTTRPMTWGPENQ